MNRLKVAAVLFIAFAFCAGSCKIKVTPLNSDMKSRFSYKPGSYWVYLDTISGKYDSFSLQSNKSSVYNESNTENYEEIQMEIDDRTNTQRTLSVALGEINGIEFQFVINVSYLGTSFTYPLCCGNTVKNFYSVKNINGINYNNVMNTYEDNSSFYINDSVGLIRADLFDSSNSVNISWRLVRCKIVI